MLSIITLGFAFVASVQAVWPAPKQITTGEKVLYIAQTLEITYNGESLPYTYGYEPASGPRCSDKDIVRGGISRAMKAIFQDNFVPWVLRPRNSDFEPNPYTGTSLVESLDIRQLDDTEDSSCYKPLADEVDESYELDIDEDGRSYITAQTSIGVLRALETFVQLFYKHSLGTFWYTDLVPVHIEDAPKFPHRGVLLDVARSWFPVKDILRTIDAMSWNKLNRLHIHMTDSQSWPLEIPSLPKLASEGAYRRDLVYSPDDIAAMHQYAAHRGVEIIIEIDMPGHIGSVALGYPELIVAYNELPYHWWCLEPPCGALKLNSSAVDEFLETLFDDLLPRIAPYTSYFHTGGDELNRNDSMLDDGVRSNDTDVLQPLLQRFISENHKRVRDKGLRPVVWEEMPLDWSIDIGKDVLVQSWLGSSSIKKLTSSGLKVIDSNSNFLYLDCGRGQWLDFDNPVASQFYPFNDWCTPTKNWRLIYAYDTIASAGLTQEEAKLVLGGEVAVWSENIDPVNLDSLVWPRASAAGEVWWSGRQDAAGQNRSQWDASPRLADLRERMLARGVMASPVQMPFCTQAQDPKECAYF